MFPRWFPLICLCLLTAPAWPQTTEAEVNPANGDTILIVGQRPGPGLWKVSKGDHVLWLFGTYSPLPKKMVWRAQEVETLLATSQEFLQPPSGSASVGFFRGLTLLPYAIGIQNNPDGATLREVLPPEVYARWLPLKKKYLGDDDGIERQRPLFAAEALFGKGLQQAGLSKGGEVNEAILAIVKRNKIKSTASHVELPMDDPVKMIKDFKKASIDDVACFSATLDRLETDIDAMRVRANAWAKGDLDGILKLSFADRDEACGAAMRSSSFAQSQPAFVAMRPRMQAAWLASAEKALAVNTTSFGMLKLQDILDPQGVVAALQAKGYTVDKPE